MRAFDRDRRSFFAAGTAGLLLAASSGLVPVAEAHGGEDDVSAVEDMMREHGVLRRAPLVYSELQPPALPQRCRSNKSPSAERYGKIVPDLRGRLP